MWDLDYAGPNKENEVTIQEELCFLLIFTKKIYVTVHGNLITNT